MSLSAEELSDLTRQGYLQCPDWLIQAAPAARFARYRDMHRQTFAGQCEILKAAAGKLIDDALKELGFNRGIVL